MIKLYPGFYLFLILSYLAGRIGMVSTINGSNEHKRYINFQVIPESITREFAAAFQKEEKSVRQIGKKSFFNFEFGITFFYENFYSSNLICGTFTYSGHYIDPPKLI